jgi:hypothetical protein
MASNFRRDHAASPCLSTAIDNRKLPRRRMVGPRNLFWVPCSVRRHARASGLPRGVWFSIKTRRMPASAPRVAFRNVAKTGQIIFSRSSRVRSRWRGSVRMTTRKPSEKRAFSIHGRDAVGLAADFMRVCRTRLRKAAWHGRLRASRAQDRNSPTESDGHLGSCPEISVESARLGRSIAGVRSGRSLTLEGAAAMKSRLPRRARCEAGGASRSFRRMS